MKKLNVIKHSALGLMALSFTVLSALPAQAKIVYQNKDWSLDENNTMCTAMTAVRVAGKAYTLKVIVDKAGDLPVQAFVDPQNHRPSTSAFYLDLGSDTFYFTPVSPQDFGAPSSSDVTYWGIPIDTALLISTIKRLNSLNIRSVDNNQVYPFSLRGSSRTIDELSARCAQNSLFTAEEFENLFLNSSNKSINIASMEPSIAQSLRDLLLQGVRDYEDVLFAQAELDKLEAKYSQWTTELAQLNSSINQLENVRLPFLKNEKISAENKITSAQNEKVRLLNLIQSEQQKLQIAQSEYQQAQNNIAPYRPEHDRLLARLNSAVAQVNRLQNQLFSTEEDIRRGEHNLGVLRSRLNQVIRDLRQTRQDTQQTRQDLRQARRELNAFDPQREIQKRINNNGQLANIEQNINRLQQQIRQQQNTVQQAQNRQQRAKQALDQCLANKKPKENCQQERQRLRQANQDLRQAENQLQNLKQRLQNNRQRKQQIIQDIRQQVRLEHNQLRNRVTNLERRLNQLENRVNQLVQQRQNLENRLIPDQERELNRLYGQADQIRRDLQNARADRDLAQRNYDSFKQSTNYDFLEAEVRRTQAKVRFIQNTISDLQANVRRQEQIILDQTRYRDQMIQEIAQTEADLVAKKQRRIEVQKLLEPYEIEKAPLVANLEAAKMVLQKTSDQYTATLP